MSKHVWEMVLDGIRNLNPQWVIPYMNNEPFLDPDLENRVNEITNKFPFVKIELSTNGSLLSEKRAYFLLEKVDLILISLFGYDFNSNKYLMGDAINYDNVKKNILTLNKIKSATGSSKAINLVKIINTPFLTNDLIFTDYNFWIDNGINVIHYPFDNRSGNITEYKQRDSGKKPSGCYLNREEERTYIYSDGSVSFCCHDWQRKYIMGNLNDNSLIDILSNDIYNSTKEKVKGVRNSDFDFLCRHCSFCYEKNI